MITIFKYCQKLLAIVLLIVKSKNIVVCMHSVNSSFKRSVFNVKKKVIVLFKKTKVTSYNNKKIFIFLNILFFFVH